MHSRQNIVTRNTKHHLKTVRLLSGEASIIFVWVITCIVRDDGWAGYIAPAGDGWAD